MQSNFYKLGCLLVICFFGSYNPQAVAQCPTLAQTSTLTSPDCAPGLNPCTVCPGDMITLTASGTGLQPGGCVNWYYGTTSNFNPYNGEGTLLGCAEIQSAPPNPCAGGCPLTLGLIVNACGTEENNEFLAILSGGGFFVDDLSVDFNGSGSDIGTDCGWQEPDANAIATIQSFCPNGTVVGAGPGESVPPGVPVVIFTSSSYDFNYNFGGLCPLSPVIYVMQSGCSPGGDVFPQSGGSISTTVSVSCGCSDNTTYNTGSLVGGDGAFVTDAGFPPFYGNAGCGFPSFPGGGGGGGNQAIQVEDFTFTVTNDMCNGGPYYVVGIVEPLPPGCDETFTNYLGFDVPCPMPDLTGADLCQNDGPFNLNQLVDPPGTPGMWSGPGVNGMNFNPSGQLGAVELTFTPNGGCTTPATTTINVYENPTASFAPVAPVCAGQSVNLTINFTGPGPWTFSLFAGGMLLDDYTADQSPFVISVTPSGPTVYSLQNLQNLNCNGPNASINVGTTPSPSGVLSLAGPATVCSGQPTTLSVNLFNGAAPFTFQYLVNGIAQTGPPANTDPFNFTVNPTQTTTYTLTSVTAANGCTGTASGLATVTVTPAPTASIPTDTLPFCAGQPTTVPVTFGGPGPYIFVYSINGVNQTAITVPDSIKNYNLIVTPPTDTTIVQLVSLTNGTCAGTFSGVLTLIVAAPPTAVLSGDATLCVAGTANLTVNFTGTGPFVIDYTASGVAMPTDTAATNPYVLTVPVIATTTFALTGVSANGCPGTASGQAVVVVEPPLSAVISGGGQLCQNGTDSIPVMVNFMGNGPFTFVLIINNVAQPPITTTANPYIFMVKPPLGTFYELQSVNNVNCAGIASGLATVFVFTPPTADLLGNATFCDSADTQIEVDFTGTGPFTIVWTQDGALQPPVVTQDDPYVIPVSTTTTTVFELLSVESPGCIGDADGIVTIAINYAPSFTNLEFNCNPVLNNYTVEFDAVGAALPLTVLTGNGTFSGTHFTSNPIPQALGYNFVFHDANDCGDVTVSGVAGCNCVTEAGTMDLTTVEVCVGQTATATYNGGAMLDGNDIQVFILQTNPASPVGTILGWNTAPSFDFGAGMQTGVTYYISAIAGDQLPDGTVDLSDPCLSVSQGTPVIFHLPPTASLDTSAQICAGQNFQLPVTLTGLAPFTLTYALDGVPQPPVTNIGVSPYVLSLQPLATTSVSVVSVSDQRCSTAGGDTALIVVSPTPQIINVQTICDFNTNTYTITFEVVGQAPFNVTGVAGFIIGSQFTSLPISSVTPSFSITLSDAGNCGQTTFSGTADCQCQTNAGTLAQVLVTACSGDPVTATHNGDQTVQSDDAFQFILHTNPGLPLGVVLATGATPSFAFMPGVTVPGQIYYVSSVAGNNDGAGNPDPNDPCYSVATGAPVVWRMAPSASLTGNFDVCANQDQVLTVTFNGDGPYDFSYTSNALLNTATSPQDTFLINSNVALTTVYTLTAVQDSAGCPGTVSGQAVVTVHPTPEIVNLEITCAPDGQSYTVEFDVTNADLPVVNVSLLAGNYDPTTGHFTSDPFPINTPYAIVVTDNWLCGRDSIGGLPVCACTTDAGNLSQTPLLACYGQSVTSPPATGFTLDGNDTLLYFLVSDPNPASWFIIGVSATPTFLFNPGLITSGTTYYIVAVAGDATPGGLDLSDPCLSVALGSTVVWQQPVTATLNGMTAICAGDTTLFFVQLSGGAPYSLVYAANGVNQTPQIALGNTFAIQVIPLTSVTYTLVSVTAANGCTGTVSGSATVDVVPPPEILDIETTCDFDNQTYTVVFHIGNGAAINPVYSVSGLNGALSDTTFTSVPIPANQPFSFTVSNPTGCSTVFSGTANCLCTTDAGTLVQTPLHPCVGTTVTLQPNGDATLETDDILIYVLCEDPAMLPQGILAVSSTPEMAFQSNMETDSTYYIVVMAGNPAPDGLVDPADPCLSVSSAVPVTFHALPTATLSGDTTVCAGGGALFQVQFTGVAPFDFVFANNGIPQNPVTAPQNSFTLSSSNIQNAQVFSPVSVADLFCPGIISGQATVDVIAPTGHLSGDATICTGDSAILTLDLDGAPLYDVVIGGGSSPIVLNSVLADTTILVDLSSTTTFTITGLSSVGLNCPGEISGSATVTLDDLGMTATLSDYGGFNVSCPNGDDGVVQVAATGGVPPLTVLWSNGATGLVVNNLSPGSYSVTLTDSEGCAAQDTFFLAAPPELLIELNGQAPRCFGDNSGVLTITGVSGSVGPYSITLDGAPVGTTDSFPLTINQLTADNYVIEATDANGCTSTADVLVPEADELLLSLGPDTTIHFGDSLLLTGVTNALAYDSLLWSPVQWLRRADSLSIWAMPEQTIRYQLLLIDSNGCVARDEIIVTVETTNRVYVPNVIAPGSGSNAVLAVFAGPEVANVNFLRVYDRWGECVYEGLDLRPNNAGDGWDGRWRGKEAPPGVYVYVLEVAYINGATELIKGDLTVVR